MSKLDEFTPRDLYKLHRKYVEEAMEAAAQSNIQTWEDVDRITEASERVYGLQWAMSDYKRLPFLNEKYWFDYPGHPDRPCVEEAATARQLEFLQACYHRADPLYQWTLLSRICRVEQRLARWILDRKMEAAASKVYLESRGTA
jgi:hypothetical protein